MSKFKFYTPFELIKAKDDAGNQVMKLGGIASTIDEDSDGEFLDPEGFDIDDFIKVGFVNWHHQAKNKPKTIVGEPSKAEKRKEGFYVETTLYPSSDTATEIYELAQILEKDSKTRRLGYSIEGEVIERESDDKTHPGYKKIKKAIITGLAITHMPKNGKTFAEIIKGHVSEESDEDEDDIEKMLDTESGKPITKESVDKKLKILKSKFSIVKFSEERMYDTIFDTFTDITIEKAEKVYNLLNKINLDMAKGKINDNQLEKAMNALGLEVDNNNPFLVKGSDDERADEIAKKIQRDYYDDKDEDGDKKGKKKKDGEDGEDEVEKSIKNSLSENKGLYLLIEKKIEKAMSQSSKENSALGVLTSAVLEENSLLKGHIENQESALEGQTKLIEEQSKLIKGLADKLERFGSTPAPRKSIVKGYAEKESFQKSRGTANASTNVLSITDNKRQILDLLDSNTFAKGFDEEMSKACMSFESSNSLPMNIISRLKAENNITITQ